MKRLITLLLIASTLSANAQKDTATGGGGSGYINDSLTSGSILSNGLYATPTLGTFIMTQEKEDTIQVLFLCADTSHLKLHEMRGIFVQLGYEIRTPHLYYIGRYLDSNKQPFKKSVIAVEIRNLY